MGTFALAAVGHSQGLPQWVPIALLALIALCLVLIVQLRVRKALGRYWDRACTGRRWSRRFPDSTAPEIREFLDLFIDAFNFRRKRRLCFEPDDKVLDVYRALYPPGMPDDLEVETFCDRLKERYGVDIAASWRPDVTLGEIYSQTRPRRT